MSNQITNQTTARSGRFVGSDEHKECLTQRVVDFTAVALHNGYPPEEVRKVSLCTCRRWVAVIIKWQGLGESRAETFTAAAQRAIERTVIEYDPDDPRFSAETIEAKRADLLRDSLLELVRHDPVKSAVVLRLREAVRRLDVDKPMSDLIVARYLQDPSQYDAQMARGVDVTEYSRGEAERIEEELRQSEGDLDESETDWTTIPHPRTRHPIRQPFRRVTLPVEETVLAIDRYDEAADWVRDVETAGGEHGELARARIELAEATNELCLVIRRQVEGCDDVRAVTAGFVTYVDASPALERHRILVLVSHDNAFEVHNPRWASKGNATERHVYGGGDAVGHSPGVPRSPDILGAHGTPTTRPAVRVAPHQRHDERHTETGIRNQKAGEHERHDRQRAWTVRALGEPAASRSERRRHTPDRGRVASQRVPDSPQRRRDRYSAGRVRALEDQAARRPEGRGDAPGEGQGQGDEYRGLVYQVVHEQRCPGQYGPCRAPTFGYPMGPERTEHFTLDDVLADIRKRFHRSTFDDPDAPEVEPIGFGGLDLAVWKGGRLLAVVRKGDDGEPVVSRFD